MKSIKLNFAIVAVAFGLTAALGFKAPAKQHRVDNPFWQYDGSGSTTDPSNYTMLEGEPDCEGSTSTCAIQAPVSADPSKPVIDNNLATRITNNDTSDHDVFLLDAQ